VLETMVMVKDETIGDLEISKKVTNDSSDKKFEDKEFEFSVKLYETVKNGDGTESKKPVSGDFACLIKSSGADDKERTVTFDADGKAALTLKTGQSILIKDLPASAEYEVKEKAADYWTVSSSKDGAAYMDKKTVTGTVPQPADDGSKRKSTAAYNNTYSPEAATLSIPVEKKFNAWNDEAFEKASFDIRLTAIGNTGSGDVNKTMPEGSTLDGEGRVTVAKSIAKSGSKADSKGYVSSTGSFDGLTFTHAGTYIYTLKEIFGDVTSVSYSAAAYDVKVTVTDDGKGRLSASHEITAELDDNGTAIPSADRKPQDKATFINTYKDNHGYMDIRIHKTYENETGLDAMMHNQFQFKMEAVGDNKGSAPLPGNPEDRGDDSVTVGNTISGSVSFPTIEFGTKDAGKAYVYKITEVMPKGASEDNDYTVNGTKYDPNEFYARVTVTATGGKALETSIEYFTDAGCTRKITKDDPETGEYLYETEVGVYCLWFSNSYKA
ncbi:MAG: Spy0128 family protein, partial [Clostridia bacterium]